MTVDVDLTDLIEQAEEDAVADLAGPMAGKVESYDPIEERAVVTPQVGLYGGEDDEPVLPVPIPHVRVCWPGAGDNRITWPLPPGSGVLLVPLGHDHSAWMSTGTPGQPAKTWRRFDLADVVALPLPPLPDTAYPADPLTYDAAWAVAAGQWSVGGNASATGFVALAARVLGELNKIKEYVNNHSHAAGTYSNSGGAVTGTSGTPVSAMPDPESVAAATLKAK